MSLATRCTRCGTIFKVVEDQLKVSEGWVRCGRCQEVFHAVPNLFDLDKDPPPPRSAEARAFAPSGFGDLDNPPSQPSEWPATQPQTQPGELDTQPTAASPADEPVAQPSTVPASLASPAPHGAEPAHTAAVPSTVPDDTPAPGPKVGPQPAPPQTRSWLAPVPATTDFDLDTQVKATAGLPPAPGEAAPAAPLTPGLDDIELDTAVPLSPRAQPLHDEPLNLRLSPMGGGGTVVDDDLEPQGSSVPADWASPSRIDLVPSTEESDALDSRYLLPSSRRERPAARRPSDAPDFADAEFPHDWLLEAEEEERAARAAAEAAQAEADERDAQLAAHQAAMQAARQAQEQEAQAEQAARAAAQAASRLMGAALPTSTTATQASSLGSDQPNLPAHPAEERDGSTVPSQFLEELEGLAAPQAPAAAPLESQQPQPSGLSALRRKKPKAKPEAEPGFVKQAQAQARWRHPAVRATLLVLTVGLLLTLSMQVVHQFRDLIAAYHPALRPYLAQWCEQAGCKLQAPMRIEDLQVDSLTFVRATSEGPDAYRLTVVLHNKAPVDLAWPAIDLSLTDTTGALLIRRVFSPQDATWQDSAEAVAQAASQPPAAAPAQRSTTLQWRLKIAQLQPAGYTADIFYP